MLKLLEALKLYLNVKGCVYFLGLDHEVVRKAIEKQTEIDVEGSQRDYLDKIVQIPFLIPRIHRETARGFIEGLLPDRAKVSADAIRPRALGTTRTSRRCASRGEIRGGIGALFV